MKSDRYGICSQTKEPFGAAAVRLGYANSADIVRALEEQQARQGRNEKRPLIGLIMVELGIMTPEQVSTILHGSISHRFKISEDAFRLATRLHASLEESAQLLVFSGDSRRAETGEVCAQVSLALAMMQHGRVLYVDACPPEGGRRRRRPVTRRMFKLDGGQGLYKLLAGECDLDTALARNQAKSLDVLPAGEAPTEYVTLLLSEHCQRLFQDLRQEYQYILAEIPRLLNRADAPVLASRSDGTILVVSAGRDRCSELQRTRQLLEGINRPLLGIILYRPR